MFCEPQFLTRVLILQENEKYLYVWQGASYILKKSLGNLFSL